MKVLCLHPSNSSAQQLRSILAPLQERLWGNHRIELVFADAPLLQDAATTTTHQTKRSWYYLEDSTNATFNLIKYTGLDASLLHLAQIWSSSSEGPFQGVLGIGQGGSVAALLPFLTRHYNHDSDSDTDQEEEELSMSTEKKEIMFQGLQFVVIVNGKDIAFTPVGEEMKRDWTRGHDAVDSNSNDTKVTDCLIKSRNNISENESAFNVDNPMIRNDRNYQNDHYNKEHVLMEHDDGFQSLHIILQEEQEMSSIYENNINMLPHSAKEMKYSNITTTTNLTNGSNCSSYRLARHYGPSAQIHLLSQPLHYTSTNSTSDIDTDPPDPCTISDISTIPSHLITPSLKALSTSIGGIHITPSLFNTIGKFLLSQKKRLLLSKNHLASRSLVQLQHQLADLEQVATIALMQEIQHNPPKALLAMIGRPPPQPSPLDTINAALPHPALVGAWKGPRRREFGEEGGGAPCPKEFLYRKNERN